MINNYYNILQGQYKSINHLKKKCTIIAISWQIGPKDSMSDNQRSKERTCKTIIYLIQNEI